MSGCVLRVRGDGFAAETFAAGHVLPYERIWKDSFNALASDCEGDDLLGQVKDSIQFLREHVSTLQALGAEGVEMSLDFGLWEKDTFTQSFVLPAELVRIAGELGVGLGISLYPVAP